MQKREKVYIGGMDDRNFSILEKLEYLANSFPDKVAVLYEPGETMSYRELWELTGKIYAFLKDRGIGAEDVVMYCLPRGLNLFACMIGTMRAGAAFVLTETGNSEQRTAFIKKDCGCKLFIDPRLFQEILKTKSAEGYVPENKHSLCYIAYTSGTTGSPKGVLHEYGSLENACKKSNHKDEPLFCAENVFLLMGPMNFVSFPIVFGFSVAYGIAIAIMPYAYGESEEKLTEYMERSRVNCGYVTPSFMRKHPTLRLPWKKCILSSESADGIFVEGPENYNCYASSESGCLLTAYRLPHAMSPAPVGFQKSDVELLILREDGTVAQPGEVGEICFRSPYIRGYLHLPRETERLMRGGVFHTGDAGKVTEDGLVVCGRMTEMFKVQGFRIEPEEVEKAVTEFCGIKNPIVRGFVYKDISSVVVFYTGKQDVDVVKAREKLLEHIPEYMVPTNFIRVDHFPLLETGKLDRSHLLPREGNWGELLEGGPDKFPVVGKGRTSTVLRISDNKVMKLFHASIPFSTIQGEYESTRLAHLAGVPSPDAYDVVLSRKRHGIILDYMQGENLEELVAKRPDMRSELLKQFAASVRNVHGIRVSDPHLPDMRRSAISTAKNLDRKIFSESNVEKICRIFESIPESDGFVHGDCHTGNAIFDEGRLTFVDLTLCGKGHPIFDLVCMCSHYIFLPSFVDDQEYKEKKGITKWEAESIFEEFLGYYYETADTQFLGKVRKQLLGILAARICLATVLFPGSFNELVIQTAKKLAVEYSESCLC